jgi:transcriptional regulator with XRE-family HTH domain
LFIIAERLRELRIKFGYTQNQIAKVLNVDRSTYAYYETGKTRPDVTTLMMLAKIYGVSLDALLEDESAPKAVSERLPLTDYIPGKKNSSHIYDLSSAEKELIGSFRTCTAEEQNHIREYVAKLIKRHGGPPRAH